VCVDIQMPRNAEYSKTKGRTYVKQGDKKVYVKKLFTPVRNSSPMRGTPVSPGINVESVDSQKRRIFKDSKGLYVMQNGKRAYDVKDMFTPPRIVFQYETRFRYVCQLTTYLNLMASEASEYSRISSLFSESLT
jgi:hypothetical protein